MSTATKVCASADLAPDQALKVVVDGIPIAVVKDSSGTVHALGDTCTHGDISLSEGFVEGDTLECWAHGSKFSLATGKPLNLPAYEPVPVFVVTIIDGDVYVDPSVTVDISDSVAG
jgi:3-phenylpropionate/trans-cinnamate dioxygenase ferredoxin subunit